MEEQISAAELTRRAVIMRVSEAIARLDVATDGLRTRLSEVGGRVVVQANARAARRPIRVQVAAAEAADDLGERLGRRILANNSHSTRNWSPPGSGTPCGTRS